MLLCHRRGGVIVFFIDECCCLKDEYVGPMFTQSAAVGEKTDVQMKRFPPKRPALSKRFGSISSICKYTSMYIVPNLTG